MPEDQSSSNSPDANAELVPVSASEALERASVDSQITTAKRYPRSLQLFKKRAIDMACLDEETAESCLYRRPVGMKDGVQQFAEGMSVRMAEIVGASYGNLRVQAQIIEQTPRFVRARGTAIDLESNFASSSEVIESTVDKRGNPFSERMSIVIAKSALSKAKRDATFSVVPRALAKPVETEVRKLLMGDSEALTKRRARVVQWINKLGIDVKRVYGALKVAGEAELGAEQLEMLTGIRTALKDNETTIDEAFPESTGEPGAKKVAGISGEKNKEEKPESKPQATPAQEAEYAATKKKAIDELEGIALDIGWGEKGMLALVGKTGGKLSDLHLTDVQKLIEMAKKENQPKK